MMENIIIVQKGKSPFLTLAELEEGNCGFIK